MKGLNLMKYVLFIHMFKKHLPKFQILQNKNKIGG